MGRNARKEDHNERSWTTEAHKKITILTMIFHVPVEL